MRKWILISIIMVWMTSLVVGSNLCEERLDNGSSCTMVTPRILCTNYTYDIIYLNGTNIVNNSNLTSLGNNQYSLNFSLETGEYVVMLCNNITQRDIRVTETLDKIIGVGRMEVAITMMFSVLIGLFTYLTFSFKHVVWKVLFGYATLGFTLLTINMGRLFAVSHNSNANIIKMLTTAYGVLLWITLLLVFVGFIVGFYFVIKKLKESHTQDKRGDNFGEVLN